MNGPPKEKRGCYTALKTEGAAEYATCPHSATVTQQMPPGHVHYAAERCVRCGRHVRWLPRRVNVSRRNELTRKVARLRAMSERLSVWQRKFIRDMAEQTKFSPKQAVIVDRLWIEYAEGQVMTALFCEPDVRETLCTIAEPGCVFEVRALDASLNGNRRIGTVSGYFDSADACLSELKELASTKGIYFTVNPVNPALLARCANRLAYANRNATTNDQHIVKRRWMFVDVDADRPSGISASDNEKEAAHNKAREVYRFLKDRGWPEPLAGDSGNGYHLLFRLDLRCKDERLFEKLLAALADRFDGDGVKLDRSVFNPSRLARLYGTLAAKGDNTLERPHRLSKLLKVPDELKPVSAEQLCAVVDELRPEQPNPSKAPPPRKGAFDVEAFLAHHGVEIAEKIVEPSGRIKWRLANCVFNPDHESPDAAVFQNPDGSLGHRCLHNSCTGKDWQEFREHFEPGYKEGRGASKNNKADEEKSPHKSAATEVVELAELFEFFHDPQDRPFARLELNGHVEVWPVESAKFKKLLARTYYEKTKQAINRNALSDAVTTLAGKACHDGSEEPVFLRVAPNRENILIRVALN